MSAILPFIFTAYCHLPKESGECENSFPAWYYDHLEGVCKEFVFGGCGGNENRFTSREVCESSCSREGTVNSLCTTQM